MNRTEALRILGLDEDANLDDIKSAYKETAQILHPDRFATNKKLQDRATEQFKNLQEAYEYLTSGKASRRGKGSSTAQAARRPRSASSELEARLAGIAAARVQLVKQRDVAFDERRNGLIMALVGVVVAVLFRRPGFMLVVASIGIAAVVWGVIQAISAQRTITTLNEHLTELTGERRRLESELDNLE